MKRRSVLASMSVAGIGSMAGCLSATPFGDDSYPTMEYGGQSVPLAPLADVYEWYEDDDATFVDTRGQGQYEYSHIDGAVLSTAPDGVADDPTDSMDRDTRIVTYCDCPHTLAVQRGSRLIADGFESVFALDDGFPAWIEAGYPIEQGEFDWSSTVYELEGQSDPAYAGEYVLVSEVETDQRETSRIGDDGRYTLSLRFAHVTDETVLVVDAPDYTVERPLGELTNDVITG